MQRNDLTLYSVRMADKPMRYQSSFSIREIVAGAAALNDQQRQVLSRQGCLFDDQCSHSISHLNPWWGELTAVYFLLQENTEPLIGNVQYRRTWNDGDLSALPLDALGINTPCYFPFSLAVQFNGGHHFPGVEMSMHLAQKGKLPFTPDELGMVWSQNMFQGGPMAVGRFADYKQLMTVLFDCLWPIWEEYEEYIKSLEGYDQRAIAFLSERLLSGIVLYKEKFIPRIPLRNMPLHFFGP